MFQETDIRQEIKKNNPSVKHMRTAQLGAGAERFKLPGILAISAQVARNTIKTVKTVLQAAAEAGADTALEKEVMAETGMQG